MNFLREKGIEKKDEHLIFQAIEKLREITKEATKNSKSARRRQERIQHAHLTTLHHETPEQQCNDSAIDSVIESPAQPFEDIEIW